MRAIWVMLMADICFLPPKMITTTIWQKSNRNKGFMKRGEKMKMHIEYDDFGWYVEANDEGTLYAVGAVEDAGDQK